MYKRMISSSEVPDSVNDSESDDDVNSVEIQLLLPSIKELRKEHWLKKCPPT